MKNKLIILVLVCLALPIFLLSRSWWKKENRTENIFIKSSWVHSPDLESFVEKIEGTWVNEEYVRDEALRLETVAEGPDVLLDIRKQNIRDGLLAIYIAEYCRPEEAEFLMFSFDGEKLVYKGAEWDGCFIDLPRIDFMTISYEDKQGIPILTFEAREVDYQYHRQVSLLKLPEDQAGLGWHCQMQYNLIDILTKGSYTLYDPNFQEISLTEAFGNENLLEELAFFEAFHTAWPMFEEICVSAPFEVVVLGDNHPKGNMKVFGIEWTSSEIRLYETLVPDESEDGVYPLQKGPLKVIMGPKIVLPSVENF